MAEMSDPNRRYLRNKVDGFIYDWHPILAQNPKVEEVTAQEAYPERFVPAEVTKRHAALRKDDRQLDLFTSDVPIPPPVVNHALNADASRARRK